MKVSPPAFPTWLATDSMAPGMTLRDYFAATAIEKMSWVFYMGQKETERSLKEDAKRCYEIADAMLKARNE